MIRERRCIFIITTQSFALACCAGKQLVHIDSSCNSHAAGLLCIHQRETLKGRKRATPKASQNSGGYDLLLISRAAVPMSGLNSPECIPGRGRRQRFISSFPVIFSSILLRLLPRELHNLDSDDCSAWRPNAYEPQDEGSYIADENQYVLTS